MTLGGPALLIEEKSGSSIPKLVKWKFDGIIDHIYVEIQKILKPYVLNYVRFFTKLQLCPDKTFIQPLFNLLFLLKVNGVLEPILAVIERKVYILDRSKVYVRGDTYIPSELHIFGLWKEYPEETQAGTERTCKLTGTQLTSGFAPGPIEHCVHIHHSNSWKKYVNPSPNGANKNYTESGGNNQSRLKVWVRTTLKKEKHSFSEAYTLM